MKIRLRICEGGDVYLGNEMEWPEDKALALIASGGAVRADAPRPLA